MAVEPCTAISYLLLQHSNAFLQPGVLLLRSFGLLCQLLLAAFGNDKRLLQLLFVLISIILTQQLSAALAQFLLPAA